MALSPAGFTTTIDGFGDSLLQGAGGNGRNIETALRARLPGRIINNWGIGGQKTQQILARLGSIPLMLNITGGQLPAGFATATVVPSVQLLSTPADNTTRYLSGTILGYPATLIRSATGGPPSTTETYTIMGAGNPAAVTVPEWAPFIPDQGTNASDSILIIEVGRNDVPTLSAVPGLIEAAVASAAQPSRVIVVGILAALGETNGSATKIAIDSTNEDIRQRVEALGAVFVPFTPPTAAEMSAVGYSPTSQDNTDIGNGVFPTGMRSDSTAPYVHLTGAGYQIEGNRIADVIIARGL